MVIYNVFQDKPYKNYNKSDIIKTDVFIWLTLTTMITHVVEVFTVI